MEDIVAGAALGGGIGAGFGFFIAMASRDGIWPEVWLWLTVVGVIFGTAFGALAWGLGL